VAFSLKGDARLVIDFIMMGVDVSNEYLLWFKEFQMRLAVYPSPEGGGLEPS
jgi:hypothetical protein